MTSTKQLAPKDVKDFVLAGNATITLSVNHTHFTYKIIRSHNNGVYFVRLLSGPDNEQDYTYLGAYITDACLMVPCKTWKGHPSYTWPASLRLIWRLLYNIENIPRDIRVYHEGRCGRCGRKLTTPESIERGYGPECYKLI